MSQPLLTIVTVTKNCAATLEKTLLSVAAVKNADVEYIVIDGVSSDGTLALIGRYGGLVDNLVSEPDTGIYNAMNKGIALAKGRYVLFINGDDELIPAGFADVTQVLREGRADVVCATTFVGSVASPSEVLIAQPWRLPFFNSVPHPSAFVTTDLLRHFKFREDLRIVADYDLFLRLFLSGKRFVKVDSATALHHRGGVSGNQVLSQTELERVKSERLGWRYPITNAITGVYRCLKKMRQAACR